MSRLTDAITRGLSWILIVLMAVIVLDVSWQVASRFILKNPSAFTDELAGFLLIWIGVLGAAYALRTRSHLGIDVLTHNLVGSRKRAVEITIYSIVFLFALFILTIGGWRLMRLTFTLNQVSPAMGIPMGYVYSVLPLTGILFMYYSVIFILEALRNPFDTREEIHVGGLD